MRIRLTKTTWILACGIFLYSAFAIAQEFSANEPPRRNEDSGSNLVFPIPQKDGQSIDELRATSPIDLKDPDNIQTSVEYDPVTGHYIFRTKIGDEDISNPYVLNSEEYRDYSMQRSMQEYWDQKNQVGSAPQNEKKELDITNMQFDIGKGENIFGPGGIQVQTQGSTELGFGLRKTKIDNPTLTERSRNPPPTFDFNQKIQLSVRGSVGDRINLAMNYNTEASFDYDQQLIKLAYEGKEDDILQKLEAGNVSMPLSSSLITGSSALFGLKTQLKFGRLTVDAVLSQQESDKQTVSLRNGAQTTPFDISADAYDENRHFFLAHHFHNNYDRAMSTLPMINSSVRLNRVEVWVTNKRGNFEQARNIVAFTDLGESNPDNMINHIPPMWTTNPGTFPSNASNSLYETVTDTLSFNYMGYTVRNIDGVSDLLSNYGLEGGEDYEKLESARLLTSSEYYINYDLGYISLRSALNSDEVLAVAFEYTAGGRVFQVGEFSTDIKSPQTLVVKLLKGTNLSPFSPTWNLMMKNVYALGGFQLQRDRFELNVFYQSDSTGVQLPYIPNTPIDNTPLLRVMNLDRLDNHNEPRPDGFFDFIEGYTVISATGRIIFPVVEPFGSHLMKKLGNDPKYSNIVYQELYDSTLITAQEFSEKNKFRLRGKYKASSGSEIRLNAMNVPRGSVSVTAGGVKLTENVDYTVDYTMGTVSILNTSILDSGTSIDVSLENQSYFNTQRKTLMGTHLNYKINDDFNVGGTILRLSEKPLTQKVNMGYEPISNTIWGLNAAYRTQSQWLTNALDKIPLLKATAPSSIAVNGEFAHLIPGSPRVINNFAHIDDFESTKIGIDIRMPHNWKLSSAPTDPALFPDAPSWTNFDVTSGYGRALLAWYSIDPIFTRDNNNTPRHIRNDADQLSSNFIREIREQEIFPNRQTVYGQPSTLTTLNLSFYPTERGPYNLDWQGTLSTGKLSNPEKRWGGIMRSLQTSDFETANIEYIMFWLMDPFVNDDQYMGNPNINGGDLYFNLGDISEDILKDGKKSFESGLPTDGDMSKVTETVWGYVPRMQSMVNAFQAGNLAAQDLGLNGLTDTQEREFGDYKDYVDQLLLKVDQNILAEWQNDRFSPLNDPAGDNYHYFRGSDYDNRQLSVLERYKKFNNTQGNSTPANESYSTAATSLPDVEDINSDNTLNEHERFYQYRVSLRKEDMEVGRGYIVDKVPAKVEVRNGSTVDVDWYQFKIPIREFDKKVGNINNFRSIRFIRMFLHGFTEEAHLRFGALELVRGEWRRYTKDLRYDITDAPMGNGTLDVSAVNIEENSRKQPVGYILPPGVTRVIDPGQQQIRQENEQAMMMRINNLDPKDARAVFKLSGMDMRQYKRLQMFVHAERPIDDPTHLQDHELTAFIRLGSDHTNNFYEYEIPLKLTPHDGDHTDPWVVWPKENMFDFPLDKLIQVKNERNRLRNNQSSNVSLTRPFFKYDTDNPMNKITIVGNPSISEVQVIMIGIRNQSSEVKNGEIWVNELRLSGFNEEGGYAALANAVVNLSDLGSITLSGRTESSGFGSIEQGIMGRNMDDYYQLNFAAGLELGRFLPEKTKIRIPFFYSTSQEVITPKYNPLDQDVLLREALDAAPSRSERDSLRNVSQDVTTSKSVSFSNVKVDIQSQKPQFYDPTNFSFGYTYNETNSHNAEIEYELMKNHRGTFNYNYSITPKPFEPFAKSKMNATGPLRLIKDFNVNYVPSYIAYSNNITRFYYEMQVRDLTNTSKLDPSFRQDFTWSRNFDLKYDFSRSLKFTFSTATNSRIDEPYMVVNRELYPDEYQHWKDSVWSNILKFGRPLAYQQMFTADYNVPLNKIPALNWVTLRGMYNSTYNWERGIVTRIEDVEINFGHTAANVATWQIDSRLNLETLYKKSAYLARVNDRFSARRPQQQQQNRQPKKFSEKTSLKANTRKDIRHRLNSRDIEVTATDENGKAHPIRHRIVDANTISVRSRNNIDNLTVNISTVVKEETPFTLARDGFVRTLMMVRNVSGTYKESNSLVLPGYQETTGFLGQRNSAPGHDFTFGFFDNDRYIAKATRKGWLMHNDSIGNPVGMNKATDLQLRASVEPFRSFRIELNALRTTSESQTITFFQNEPTKTFTGTFSMTQAAIGTSFWKIGKTGNFDSRAYENFLEHREIMAARITHEYTRHGDATYDGININSSDVLIPAFLSAYTNRNPSRSTLGIFPQLKNMLPNWRITYNGLSNIEAIKKYFKSVNLNHAYRCTYNVGSYSSLLSWTPGANGHYGYTNNVIVNSNTVLSSQYDVGTVTITESFSPLAGVDVTTQNNISFKVEYKRTRTLSLSVPSTQVIESHNNEWVFGAGYILKNFNTILRIKQRQNAVNNDLTLRGDVSIKDMKAVIRKIEEEYSQPTSGSKALGIRFTADYVFSEKVNIGLYFNRLSNMPFISSSYPTVSTDFGVTFRFLLTR